MNCRNCGKEIWPFYPGEEWLKGTLTLVSAGQMPSSFWRDGEALVCEITYSFEPERWKWHRPELPEPDDLDDLLALERELR